MNDIEHIKKLYKEKRFKVISERMIEVDSQIVQEVTKKGRKIITCSCENSSTFAHANICRHKKFFIMLPLLELQKNKIDKLLNYYVGATNGYKEPETKQLAGFFCSDLEELKRI